MSSSHQYLPPFTGVSKSWLIIVGINVVFFYSVSFVHSGHLYERFKRDGIRENSAEATSDRFRRAILNETESVTADGKFKKMKDLNTDFKEAKKNYFAPNPACVNRTVPAPPAPPESNVSTTPAPGGSPGDTSTEAPSTGDKPSEATPAGGDTTTTEAPAGDKPSEAPTEAPTGAPTEAPTEGTTEAPTRRKREAINQNAPLCAASL